MDCELQDRLNLATLEKHSSVECDNSLIQADKIVNQVVEFMNFGQVCDMFVCNLADLGVEHF